MKRAAFAVLVLSTSSGPLGAQSTGRLGGTVIDSLSGKPFASAVVRATRVGAESELTLTAVADGAGR